MATSTGSTTGVSLVLQGKWLYALLLALIALAVVGTWVFTVVPNFLGLGALAAGLVALFGYAAHDLTDDTDAPGWVTFIVILVGGGLMAAAGTFAHNTAFTDTSILAAALVFLSFLLHGVAADAGKSLSANIENWLTAGLGAAVAIVQFISSNPTASAATIIVTVVLTLSQFFHVTEEDGQVSVTPAAAPAS
jgi:hypothetical protein